MIAAAQPKTSAHDWLAAHLNLVPTPARRAQPRATDRLGAELGHDLRGLLTVVKGHAELLAEGDARGDDGLHQRSCQTILWSCKMIADLIENGLALERMDSGQLPQQGELDLRACLRSCVVAYAVVAQKKQTRIGLGSGDEQVLVAADPRSVTRIVSNLLSNAIKFSPGGSTITVSIDVGADVRIDITDQGPGIVQDEAGLFEAYAKGTARPTAGERSTGLGLAIVSQLVERCGGSVEVDGRPGCGAVFSVTLPKAAA